jgi:hypothetical protein
MKNSYKNFGWNTLKENTTSEMQEKRNNIEILNKYGVRGSGMIHFAQNEVHFSEYDNEHFGSIKGRKCN